MISDLLKLSGALGIFGILAIAIVGAVIAVWSLMIMLLWNGLMPAIFGLPTIDFLQALGLLALSSLLFGRIPTGKNSKEKE